MSKVTPIEDVVTAMSPEEAGILYDKLKKLFGKDITRMYVVEVLLAHTTDFIASDPNRLDRFRCYLKGVDTK